MRLGSRRSGYGSCRAHLILIWNGTSGRDRCLYGSIKSSFERGGHDPLRDFTFRVSGTNAVRDQTGLWKRSPCHSRQMGTGCSHHRRSRRRTQCSYSVWRKWSRKPANHSSCRWSTGFEKTHKTSGVSRWSRAYQPDRVSRLFTRGYRIEKTSGLSQYSQQRMGLRAIRPYGASEYASFARLRCGCHAH